MSSRRGRSQPSSVSARRQSDVWLGIDFSGDALRWRGSCSTSNVWLARVEEHGGALRLATVDRVNRLSGAVDPFDWLVSMLASPGYSAAAIDAPFSVPERFLAGDHRAALQAVAALEREGRPFPRAAALVRAIAGRDPPLSPAKPLRETEALWRVRGVNVRSTLWAGARGGAAMTAACMTLLARAGCRLWPWQLDGEGLVAEAFPAAQLRQWSLPHQKYNGPEGRPARDRIVDSLRVRLHLGTNEAVLRTDADALDAVIAAFGARAAKALQLASTPAMVAAKEGWIAVHA